MMAASNAASLGVVLALGASIPLGLQVWLQAVGGRAWPWPPAPHRSLWLLPLVMLQTACAIAWMGPVAGLIGWLALWMLVGWAWVLLLNAAPDTVLRLSRPVGLAGTAATLAALLAKLASG